MSEISYGGSGVYGGSGRNLSECLDVVRTWLSRYIVVMQERDLDILALWIIHTWVCETTYTSPRLLIDSPVPGSGKTTLLEHLNQLCKNPVQIASLTSPAMLARMTNLGVRTILIDEADRNLDPKKPGVGDLIAILNAGYKVGALRPVVSKTKNEGFEVEEHKVFSPVAIAGNTPLLPEDTRSRCITIRLMPDNNDQAEQSDWEFLDLPANDLKEHIRIVTDEIRELVQVSRPELPKACRNRFRERWNPLARIAAVAGENWLDKCLEAIEADLALAAEVAENGEITNSPQKQLAIDLYKILGSEPRFETSVLIVDKLIKLNPEVWSYRSSFGKDLNPKRMGSILNKSFGVYSQRRGDVRGWHSNQFQTIWMKLGISQSNPTNPPEPTNPTTELF
jgi:hypothetical protein